MGFDEHPRWPAGTPDDNGGKKGGKFAPKGEGGEAGAAPTSQSHATIKKTQAATSRSIANTKISGRRSALIFRTKPKPYLRKSDRQKPPSYNDLAMGVAERDAIARTLRTYAEYRAQLWLDDDGHTVEIPAIDVGNPVAGQAELMIRLAAHEPLTRPATNADWIDPRSIWLPWAPREPEYLLGLRALSLRQLTVRTLRRLLQMLQSARLRRRKRSQSEVVVPSTGPPAMRPCAKTIWRCASEPTHVSDHSRWQKRSGVADSTTVVSDLDTAVDAKYVDAWTASLRNRKRDRR